nr:glycoside hydrolase [Acetatifactor sp.]
MDNYIRPLFWQHGEDESILREEIRQMKKAHINEFIVESRPHPDYLSFGWWRDLDVIIDEAKKQDMFVWKLDDNAYPSGLAAGKIKELYPEHLKVYMKKYQIDAIGPMKGAYINLNIAPKEEPLLKVIAAKRTNGTDLLDEDSLTDLTDLAKNGRIYWDIPQGEWRLFIITISRSGGEDWTRDYVNPISKEAVRKYIDIIYEEHYKRYASEFGKTIKGFFADEPRFGNESSYEMLPGKGNAVFPYADGLIERLSAEMGTDAGVMLPFLWSSENNKCVDVHYAYMNVVSAMFGEAFGGQIGQWCREHGVSLIGHMVEDSGAHSRLGYGCGHYFRAMEGFDEAGIDVVFQIWPEYMNGRHLTPFGYLDSEFFYWGICKMASSLAYLDEKKHGRTMCEIFGAYGWQEGLKLMKWLTDHVAVRGINVLVPHAFSPKFPDEDCPPHFYARGNNPQWPYFHIWSSYANRVMKMLSDGEPVTKVAVVYHAEAEWSGKEYQPFEKVVRVLAECQIDCDVVPIDRLAETPKYSAIVVPYAYCVSQEFLETILSLASGGVQIVFVRDYPQKIYYADNTTLLEKVKNHSRVQ